MSAGVESSLLSCDGCNFAGQSTALENAYVGVRFGEETNLTLCAAPGILLAKGASVVVATEKGPAVGWVEKSPMPVFKPCQKSSALQIMRAATQSDYDRDDKRKANEHRAKLFARERSKHLGLRMKFSQIDFTLNGTNAVFYFTSDGRVDFRQLVRDLARRFKTRVRMVQLGARDEAKLLGGIGICGKTLCCSTWMGEFRSISVQMAKRQGLSLNPTKISGQCGRLLCCLKYEDDQYQTAGPPIEERQPRVISEARSDRDPGHGNASESAQLSQNPVRVKSNLVDRPGKVGSVQRAGGGERFSNGEDRRPLAASLSGGTPHDRSLNVLSSPAP